jgi:hypothetical protein
VLNAVLLQLKYIPQALHCIWRRRGLSTSCAVLYSWCEVIFVGLVSFSGYLPSFCPFCCCTTNTPRQMIHAIIRAVPALYHVIVSLHTLAILLFVVGLKILDGPWHRRSFTPASLSTYWGFIFSAYVRKGDEGYPQIQSCGEVEKDSRRIVVVAVVVRSLHWLGWFGIQALNLTCTSLVNPRLRLGCWSYGNNYKFIIIHQQMHNVLFTQLYYNLLYCNIKNSYTFRSLWGHHQGIRTSNGLA